MLPPKSEQLDRRGTQPELLVVTSCTARKRFEPVGALTQADLRDANQLLQREAELARYESPATEMYLGQQHLRVMQSVRALRQRRVSVDLAIISAGYGVHSETRPIAPYDVTLSTRNPGEVRSWVDVLHIPDAIRKAVASWPLVIFLLGDKYLTSHTASGAST